MIPYIVKEGKRESDKVDLGNLKNSDINVIEWLKLQEKTIGCFFKENNDSRGTSHTVSCCSHSSLVVMDLVMNE